MTGVPPVVRVKALEEPMPISAVSRVAGCAPVDQEPAVCQVPEVLFHAGFCAVVVRMVLPSAPEPIVMPFAMPPDTAKVPLANGPDASTREARIVPPAFSSARIPVVLL